jgi:hypothetical protein
MGFERHYPISSVSLPDPLYDDLCRLPDMVKCILHGCTICTDDQLASCSTCQNDLVLVMFDSPLFVDDMHVDRSTHKYFCYTKKVINLSSKHP